MRHGEETGFESLFRSHYDGLCRFARDYTRSPEAAEEIVQGVFLRLWRDREGTPVVGNVVSYLYVATRNAARNHLRQERLHRLRADGIARSVTDWLHAGAPAPDEELAASETARAVWAAVDRLPERARCAARLKWQHQLSYAEIATIMGISTKGVELQLYRALKALRRHLDVTLLRP